MDLGWVILAECERQLEQTAERAAIRWAEFTDRSVPDLQLAFADGGITPAAREQLARLRNSDDLFRVRRVDLSGNPILSSDEFDRVAASGNPAMDAKAPSLPGTDGPIDGRVLSGKPHIEVERARRGDRPAVYSEAVVPIKRDGKVLGMVEVTMDQTERARQNADGCMRVAAVIAGLLLLLAYACHQFWIRLRRQRRAISG